MASRDSRIKLVNTPYKSQHNYLLLTFALDFHFSLPLRLMRWDRHGMEWIPWDHCTALQRYPTSFWTRLSSTNIILTQRTVHCTKRNTRHCTTFPRFILLAPRQLVESAYNKSGHGATSCFTSGDWGGPQTDREGKPNENFKGYLLRRYMINPTIIVKLRRWGLEAEEEEGVGAE